MKYFVLTAILLALAMPAHADPTPTPSPAATSSPSPSPSYGFHYAGEGFASFVDQAQGGPGLSPPEGPDFAAGSPLSPMTPYDTFSSAPSTPGIVGIGQFAFKADYVGRRLDASATLGFAYAGGSVQNAAYWTESLMPTLNPHLGSTSLPFQVAFPTHAGQDDGGAGQISLLSAALATHDGGFKLRGGWFDLAQTDRFVFVQPPLTNVTPSIGIQTAETLGNGAPALDVWPAAPPGLPLNGIDFVARRGIATFEIANASLPALPGTAALVTLGSIVLDHGEGTRWSGEVLHLVTGGATLNTSTLFGAGAMTNPGPQGRLPTSQLGGQRQTIVGLRGAFHVSSSIDATVELGRAWYEADQVLEPGTSKPGGFYHVALSHGWGRATLSAEFLRFEPRYATAILPYGIPENVWSVAWSWPGVWLKSNYQIADNTTIGVNRQGFRVRYSLDKGPVEIHASYARYDQIDPAIFSNVHQAGFIEGFFLPQNDGAGTLGEQHQYALWTAWHPKFGDVLLDYVNDTQHRDFTPANPQDAVSYQAPQVVLTYSRSFGKRAIAALGYGRYAMRGSWAMGARTNVDFQQGVGFVGAQFAESQHAAVLVQLRHASFSGLPSQPGGPSPDFSGSLLVVEQRYHL